MSDTGERRRPWQLRVWHGMTAGAWFRLLGRNRFAVSPSRWHRALILSLVSVNNSALSALQNLLFGRRISRTELRSDPLFILGHWRSGTTLLHELLSLDENHIYPTTYACLAPQHFLVSRKLFGRWLRMLAPKRRSQDDVRVDFNAPQEDEWALCTAGLPTPYQIVAFPNHGSPFPNYATLRDVPTEDLDRWKDAWLQFLRAISLNSSKRLVIKSPLHTARLNAILALFPNARFVHVVRDPRDVFPSTLRLWRRLAEDEGLQVPRQADFTELVLANYREMYEAFEQSRARIPTDRLCEIRYEDLVEDPTNIVRTIYQRLNLGSFESVRPEIERYVSKMRGFKTNRYELSAADLCRINQHWAKYFGRYGYSTARAA